MLFWNKIEIYNGYSLEEFTRLKDALAAANIRFDYKLTEADTRYYLYVHQKDYYHAMHLTSSRKA